MPGTRFLFRRASLAQDLADGIAGTFWLTDFSAGLFMAAPSQSGKTTFIRHDLIPEIVSREWLPIVVELKSCFMDAGTQINQKVAETLINHGCHSSLTTAREGRPQLAHGVTLATAFESLLEKTKTLIVVVIDDTEMALRSTLGSNSIFGLKAARDALNSGRHGEGLRLIMMGSCEKTVEDMTNNRRQPFYCASYQDFPRLGRDFSDAYTSFINERLAATNQFHPDEVYKAFIGFQFNPKRLMDVLKEVSVMLGAAPRLGQLLDDEQWASNAGFWIEAPKPKVQQG
jgi:hypothetical protein